MFYRKKPQGIKLPIITLASVAVILFSSLSGYTAMSELNNESLGSIKGSRNMNKQKQQGATESEIEAYSDQNMGLRHPQVSEFSLFDLRLKELDNSGEYRKFLYYLDQLEQLANEENNGKLVSSDKFMFFCASFAATAKTCSKQLTLSFDSSSNSEITPILNAKNRMFDNADSFYNHLLRYRDRKTPTPDLKKMIAEIRQNQSDFEFLYTSMKNKHLISP
jgi:hypothetical protein